MFDAILVCVKWTLVVFVPLHIALYASTLTTGN